MFPKEVEYFQAVVQTGSFYDAADICHVSQSAISQQIKKLEAELGVELLERHNRMFSLTPAGNYFYGQSLKLRRQMDKTVEKIRELARPRQEALQIGCFSGIQIDELSLAIAKFGQIYPDVSLSITIGSHEELYLGMEEGSIDLAINDQRRAFSDTYKNIILAQSQIQIEIAASHPLAQKEQIDLNDLENMNCILVASPKSQENEKQYYRQVVQIRSPFVFVSSLPEARLLILGAQAYLPVDVVEGSAWFDTTVSRLPLIRDGSPVYKNCCLFWKKEKAIPSLEAFARILLEQF